MAGEDALFETGVTTGRALRNPFLAGLLRDTELGMWSLSASTLDFLQQQIQRLKPQMVMEFGSGISTVCLARYMQELHGDGDRVYVVSLDQNAGFVQKTIESLETLQLARHARVFHAPLRRQMVEGVESAFYDVPAGLMDPVLQGVQADFVLVDGPAGDHPARFGTLPLVRRWLSPRATFLLDDALRDGELKVAQLWSSLPYVTVSGLHVNGKGLLIGRVAGIESDQPSAK